MEGQSLNFFDKCQLSNCIIVKLYNQSYEDIWIMDAYMEVFEQNAICQVILCSRDGFDMMWVR